MFLAILIFDLNWPFCKVYSLCKMVHFQNAIICRIFGFFERLFAQNNSNVLVESFFACFWPFQFMTQTESFAKSIAFARWPIFKMLSFLEYLVISWAVFCTEQLKCTRRVVFRMFLAILVFDTNWKFCKVYSLCKMADSQNAFTSRIFGDFMSGFLHRTTLMYS